MEYDEVSWDEDLMKSGSKCQKQKTIGKWLVDGVFFLCVDMSVLGCLLQVNDIGETN
jgi:hypothetical protein